jgi:hypothetical protein
MLFACLTDLVIWKGLEEAGKWSGLAKGDLPVV